MSVVPPMIRLRFPGGTSFVGTIDGDMFSATRLTEFDFSDGCHWEATETLRGTIAAETDCTMETTYTYREAPIMGAGCATPCTIDAQVHIAPRDLQ